METFALNEFLVKSSALKYTRTCVRLGQIHKCTAMISNLCEARRPNWRKAEESWRRKCPQIIKFFNDVMPKEYSSELDTVIRRELSPLNDSLPIKSFADHYQCIKEIALKLKTCRMRAMDRCRQRRIQALKIIRSNMNALDALIQKIPDLHVIYYVRDPRSILNSILRSYLGSSFNNFTAEAKLLCSKMSCDLTDYMRLSKKYPGVFLMAHYEDLVRDPVGVGDRIYRHLGLKASSNEWRMFAQRSVHGAKDTGTFGVMRRNGTASIEKWRMELSQDEIEIAMRVCHDVIERLKYPLQ